MKYVIAIVLVAVPILLCSAAAAEMDEGRQEIAKLNQELTRAKLDRMAILVDRLSKGRSALLVGKGVGANPRAGVVGRDPAWAGIPYITVYPVSAPIRTKFEGIGDGKILGAMHLRVSAVAPGGKEKAEAGVYLIFYRTFGNFRGSAEAGSPDVSLLSMTVDPEGRVIYKEVLRSPMLSHDPEEGSPTPEVTVEFPEKASVSSENPAWRVKVGMKWAEDLYRFRLDVDPAGTAAIDKADSEERLRQEVATLNQELTRAKLERIAILVDKLSGGESALLLGKGVGANPRVGHVVRDATWGDTPFVTVYGVSAPFETKLEGIAGTGIGKVLGAVSLLTPATSWENDKKVGPGVYMIFNRTPEVPYETGLMAASLISVAVSDEGRIQYKEVLRMALNNTPSVEPGVMVEFPGRESVSEKNPAWRATVGMKWPVDPEEVYGFDLDLEIEMT